MRKLLFDTSVWIAFSRKIETQNAIVLKHYIKNNGSIYLCPTIYQEIIQGSKNPNKIIDLLDCMNFLALEPYFAAKKAALMYQNLRKSGITLRNPNDCLIASLPFILIWNLCIMISILNKLLN